MNLSLHKSCRNQKYWQVNIQECCANRKTFVSQTLSPQNIHFIQIITTNITLQSYVLVHERQVLLKPKAERRHRCLGAPTCWRWSNHTSCIQWQCLGKMKETPMQIGTNWCHWWHIERDTQRLFLISFKHCYLCLGGLPRTVMLDKPSKPGVCM